MKSVCLKTECLTNPVLLKFSMVYDTASPVSSLVFKKKLSLFEVTGSESELYLA